PSFTQNFALALAFVGTGGWKLASPPLPAFPPRGRKLSNSLAPASVISASYASPDFLTSLALATRSCASSAGFLMLRIRIPINPRPGPPWPPCPAWNSSRNDCQPSGVLTAPLSPCRTASTVLSPKLIDTMVGPPFSAFPATGPRRKPPPPPPPPARSVAAFQ